MQTPTPPTKPIPPTPPTINSTSSTATGAETQKSPTTTPTPTTTSSVAPGGNSSNSPEKPSQNQTTKTAATEKPESASSADKNQTIPAPYLGTHTKTSQNTATDPITPPPTSKSAPSIGFSFILPIILLVALFFAALRWWKKTALKTTLQKRTVRNYSTDTTNDLLDLMNSQVNADSLPKPTSKLLLKPKVKKESKGNFEIRI
jgi:hypothetical protein